MQSARRLAQALAASRGVQEGAPAALLRRSLSAVASEGEGVHTAQLSAHLLPAESSPGAAEAGAAADAPADAAAAPPRTGGRGGRFAKKLTRKERGSYSDSLPAEVRRGWARAGLDPRLTRAPDRHLALFVSPRAHLQHS